MRMSCRLDLSWALGKDISTIHKDNSLHVHYMWMSCRLDLSWALGKDASPDSIDIERLPPRSKWFNPIMDTWQTFVELPNLHVAMTSLLACDSRTNKEARWISRVQNIPYCFSKAKSIQTKVRFDICMCSSCVFAVFVVRCICVGYVNVVVVVTSVSVDCVSQSVLHQHYIDICWDQAINI